MTSLLGKRAAETEAAVEEGTEEELGDRAFAEYSAKHEGKHGLHGLFPSRSSPREPAAAGGSGGGSARESRQQMQLAAAMEKVATHYGVVGSAVALRRPEGKARVEFVAIHGVAPEAELALRRHGAEEADPDCLKLFHHHMRRGLPIIIQDVSEVQVLSDGPLVTGKPGIKFYAAAPLTKGEDYIGTLSIFDAKAKGDLDIQDCEMLQKVAAEVATILREALER